MPKTISDTIMFPACVEVLKEKLVPLHYAELTRLAIQRLGEYEFTINMKRQKEDVRERLLLPGRYGCFYTGKPHYLACLSRWFHINYYKAFEEMDDYIKVEPKMSSAFEGSFEALMRSEYMLNKANSDKAVKNKRVSKGLMIEAVAKSYFKDNFPSLFGEPENHGNYRKPCDHDFILHLKHRSLKIDICGPNASGMFGNVGNKKTTDFHVLCRVINDELYITGILKGENFVDEILRNELKLCNTATEPVRFVVWLNCKIHKPEIDYIEIMNQVKYKR
jgi:hypothetical protein